MQNMTTTLVLAGGFYSLFFALFHLGFWKIFKWKDALAKLDLTNGAILQILNLCLTFFFLLMAYLSFFQTKELISTTLGKTLLGAFSLFWLLRMLEQIIFFNIKKILSIALTFLFFLGSMIYLYPFIMG